MIDLRKLKYPPDVFKLTGEGGLYGYTLTKLVHEEKNLYAEMKETQKHMELWVRGEALDDAHSVSFEIPTDEVFEIVGDYILEHEPDDRHVFVDCFNRRGGDTSSYPSPIHSQEELREIADGMEGSYVGALEEEGWEQVGYRVGFGSGKVEVKRVDKEGDD